MKMQYINAIYRILILASAQHTQCIVIEVWNFLEKSISCRSKHRYDTRNVANCAALVADEKHILIATAYTANWPVLRPSQGRTAARYVTAVASTGRVETQSSELVVYQHLTVKHSSAAIRSSVRNH